MIVCMKLGTFQMFWDYNLVECFLYHYLRKNWHKHTACLNQMYDDNDCLFGGNFMGKGTKAGQVVVSSSECLKTGNMDDIEVKTE